MKNYTITYFLTEDVATACLYDLPNYVDVKAKSEKDAINKFNKLSLGFIYNVHENPS